MVWELDSGYGDHVLDSMVCFPCCKSVKCNAQGIAQRHRPSYACANPTGQCKTCDLGSVSADDAEGARPGAEPDGRIGFLDLLTLT